MSSFSIYTFPDCIGHRVPQSVEKIRETFKAIDEKVESAIEVTR